MTVYVIRIPHQRPPMGFMTETEQEAIDYISTMYDGREFDDLDEAAGHDMHAGNWAHDPKDLLEWVRNIPHQMIQAEQVVRAML